MSAFDAASGEELWAAMLDANADADANPMTYEAAGGRQHVAVVAGDRFVAFRLP